MIPSMIDIDTLISTVKAHAAHENATRFGGRNRINVEQYKGVGIGGVFSDIPNNFCVFINTPDNPGPRAVYLYVKREEGVLKCTLRLSDKIKDFREDRELPSLPMSLGNDEIARQLVASVVAEIIPQ
jgi:hypothetical protein